MFKKNSRRQSQTTKDKIGRANKGKKRTEEMIKKMSERQTGIKLSEATKKKISLTHKGKTFSEEHKRKIGKSEKGKNHHNWKGGKYKNSQNYILIYSPKHPFAVRNYVLQSHLISEKYLNRYLTKLEVIHHINGIKDDNRPENLYLFESNSKHTKYHSLKSKPILKSNLIQSPNE